MPLDMSDNCQICGANPHEECRFPNMGNHQAINCKINPVAHDSRRDDEMVETRLEHEEEDHPDAVMIFRADSAMTSGDASNPVHSDDIKERLKQNDKKAEETARPYTSHYKKLFGGLVKAMMSLNPCGHSSRDGRSDRREPLRTTRRGQRLNA